MGYLLGHLRIVRVLHQKWVALHPHLVVYHSASHMSSASNINLSGIGDHPWENLPHKLSSIRGLVWKQSHYAQVWWSKKCWKPHFFRRKDAIFGSSPIFWTPQHLNSTLNCHCLTPRHLGDVAVATPVIHPPLPPVAESDESIASAPGCVHPQRTPGCVHGPDMSEACLKLFSGP